MTSIKLVIINFFNNKKEIFTQSHIYIVTTSVVHVGNIFLKKTISLLQENKTYVLTNFMKIFILINYGIISSIYKKQVYYFFGLALCIQLWTVNECMKT